jgi:hypothetical protein
VSIQKGKGTMDLNMFLLMKTKKVIGCWLEMFHGSKFSVSPDLLISIIKPLYIYIYDEPKLTKSCFLLVQYVHFLL